MTLVAQTPQNESDEESSLAAFLVISRDGKHVVRDLGESGSAVIGRDLACDVVLDHPDVAPRHVRVVCRDRQLVVERIGEAKVYRAGRPLEDQMRLDPGEDMAIGPFDVVVGVRISTAPQRRRALTHADLRERLVEELARAERSGRTLALVAARASFGQGARFTRAIAELLRSGDLLASYGPDEIEVALSDSGPEDAERFARAAAALEAHPVSFGYAIYPADADDPDLLLTAAHRGLDLALERSVESERAPGLSVVAHTPLAQDDVSRELANRAQVLARTEANLVIVGERSSGRATLARYIHRESGRDPERFASLSPVGSKDTTAVLAAIRQATSGTLCLREIDEWSLDAQRFVRHALAGATSVRLVATTTRTLSPLAERGVFDAELLAMIDGNRLEVPPLRTRTNDLSTFAEHFARTHGSPSPVRFSVPAFARLHAYPWPGNLVELDDAMRRAAYLAGAGEILAEHLPAELLPADNAAGRLREHVDSVERDAIVRALADNNQNQTHAARQLGLSRRALIYKMEKYGLKAPAGTVTRRSSVTAKRPSRPSGG